jgi:hypothetical protein
MIWTFFLTAARIACSHVRRLTLDKDDKSIYQLCQTYLCRAFEGNLTGRRLRRIVFQLQHIQLRSWTDPVYLTGHNGAVTAARQVIRKVKIVILISRAEAPPSNAAKFHFVNIDTVIDEGDYDILFDADSLAATHFQILLGVEEQLLELFHALYPFMFRRLFCMIGGTLGPVDINHPARLFGQMSVNMNVGTQFRHAAIEIGHVL